MDRIWQWAWDRYGARHWWACCLIVSLAVLPIYLIPSFVVVASEGSDQYVVAAASTVVATSILVFLTILPGVGRIRPAELWAAGQAVDRESALHATCSWARGLGIGLVIAGTIGGGGKLEFTLIGDTVNVAARVEHLTKNTW